MPYKDRTSPETRAKIQAYRERRRDALNCLIDTYLDECVDCGNEDSDVLEFDHVHGPPAGRGVRAAAAGGRPALLREIAKCEVRCCNCHTKRHRKERA